MSELPTIALLATGGTIASTAAASTAMSGYALSQSVDDLLAAVPDITTLAHIRARQVLNVDSRAMSGKMLLKLAARVDKALADPAVQAVVITHGTDTLEETACFLDLTLKQSPKPVVLTGAMRPASALSADGPLNLYNAVLAATHPRVRGLGVLAVLDDTLHAARYISKRHTTLAGAFAAPAQGCLGQIADGRLELYYLPAEAEARPRFSLDGIKLLPRVDILYDHQDAGLHLYEASIQAGVQGIVVAGTGNGSLSPQAEKGLRLAARNKIVCVRSSRTGAGVVTPNPIDTRRGLVCAAALNPQKARILLMLALTAARDRAFIQSCFDNY